MPPLDYEEKPLSFERPLRALDAFAEYSVSERQHRQDSGENFDPRLFEQAVELIARKLQRLENEGRA